MDELFKYFKNLYYGFWFHRVKVDDALHIPEGGDKEGNLRINGTLQVKVNGAWGEVQGAAIPVDSAPTSGSGNIPSSGGTYNAIAAEAALRTSGDAAVQTVITAETVARQAADVSLQNSIAAEAVARQNADTQEVVARVAADNQILLTLRDGVLPEGDTLQKLYNLIIGSFSEITVADIPGRDAYNAKAGDHVFVVDDGDGHWALYKATTAGVNATYVKLSDPDLLGATMTATQIKAAYESNPDTNAFTNALLAKLNAISGTNTGDQDISGIALNAAAIAAEVTARTNADATLLNTLKDGVAPPGDTLQKLYNLIIGGFSEISVANIAARDAYDAKLGDHVFVLDDGDGKWALYKAYTAGTNAVYIKLSDPDLLSSAMSASQIKASYESNPDTNAFTNALLAKLNSLDTSGIAINAANITSVNQALATEVSNRQSADTNLQSEINALRLGSGTGSGSGNNYLTTTNVGNSYSGTIPVSITGYVPGMILEVTINATNTGASSININNLGTVSILKDATTPVASGDLIQNKIYLLGYDGASFQILSGSTPDLSGIGTNADALAAEVVARQNADTTLQQNITAEATSRANGDAGVITTLRDGVATAGDTLQKLYNLVTGGFSEITVANIAARDAYNITAGFHVFVTDDGDGKWALYKATTSGVNATYVKLSDPDLLGAVMSASQVKAAYESNPDTNAFTNALLSKLNSLDTSGIAVNATAISTETTNRQNADTTLQNNINAEATARANADTNLQNQINNFTSVPKATIAEINAGLDDTKFSSPAGLEGSKYLSQTTNKLWATTTNTGNAYSATLTPAITAYTTGMNVYLKINVANTGAATVNLNGLGAKGVVKDASTPLVAGDLLANKVYLLAFDGTNFQVANLSSAAFPTVTTGEKAITITSAGPQKTYDLLDQVVSAASLTTANWSAGTVSLTGFTGQYAYDNNYRYDCVGANTWRRMALNGELVDLYLADVDDTAGAKTSSQLNSAYASAIVGQRVWGTLYLYEKKTSILWKKFPITDA